MNLFPLLCSIGLHIYRFDMRSVKFDWFKCRGCDKEQKRSRDFPECY